METVLANYPGMSAAGNAALGSSASGGTGSGGGTAKGNGKDTPEALYELVFGAKSAARFQKNGRLDHEAVYKLLLDADMPPSEKVRFANMAGLAWW